MKLVNTYKSLGGGSYSWTVSIEGTNQELSQIKYVTYLLHETFSNRRIIGRRVSNNFARTLRGWGEFLLKAEATMKDGDIKQAELWINLGFKNTELYNQYKGEFS
jgi:transcription initiation factor IIF auxiliary subunit